MGCVETLGAPGDKKVYYIRLSRQTEWPVNPQYGTTTNFTFYPALVQTLDQFGNLNALDWLSRTIGKSGAVAQGYGTYAPSSNNKLEMTSNDQVYWGNAPGLTQWEDTVWNTAAQANFWAMKSDNTSPAYSPPQWVMWRIQDNWGGTGATVGEIRLMLRSNLSFQRMGITIELLDENYFPVWTHTLGNGTTVAGPVVQWTGGTTIPNRIRLQPK